MVQEFAQGFHSKAPTFQLGYGDYLRFRDLVLERSGLHFPEKKRADLEIGLLKAVAESSLFAANGKYNLNDYYYLLCNKDDPTSQAELNRLIKTLTIGETHFFRDEAQFNALANHVLPGLIAQKRAAAAGFDVQPQLRIWSAGCASGEEPYSIAILLKELLPDIDNWHILILATDINQDALTRAREACYSEWSFREDRAKALRARYFTCESNSTIPTSLPRFRLRDDIRRMVSFASLNLIEDDYPAIPSNTVSMDLVLCRNVTIYFTQEKTRQVVNRLYEALVEGGWLVVGHSEPSPVTYRRFQMRGFANALLYQKTEQPTSWPDDWTWLDNVDEGNNSNGVGLQQPPGDSAHQPLTSNVPPSISHPEAPSSAPTPVSSPVKKAVAQWERSAAPAGSISKIRDTSPAEIDPYRRATALLEKGHLEEAIVEVQRKLAEDAGFAPAHTLLGRLYANLGRWSEATQWCQSALALDNLQADAYYVLALVYQHQEQSDLAIAMFKKAIYLEPDTPLFHFYLALLYKKIGQIKHSQRFFRNVNRILKEWPPEKIVPYSDGTTSKHLFDLTQRLLSELEF